MKVREGVFTVGGRDYSYDIESYTVEREPVCSQDKGNMVTFFLGKILSIKGCIVQGNTEDEVELELMKSLQIKLDYDNERRLHS